MKVWKKEFSDAFSSKNNFLQIIRLMEPVLYIKSFKTVCTNKGTDFSFFQNINYGETLTNYIQILITDVAFFKNRFRSMQG